MSNEKFQTDQYLIDKRDEEAFIDDMVRLSKSYAPEWNFDKENPDIAATVAILFGKQLAENVQRLNQSIDKYHTAFINLLDINARPAKPSEGIVLMDLTQDTISGTQIPRGTKLYSMEPGTDDDDVATTEDVSEVIFETQDDIYITNSRIASIFLTDYEEGTIKSILGKLKQPLILKSADAAQKEDLQLEDTEEPEIQVEEDTEFKPFKLFGEVGGVEKNISLIYHEYAFNSAGDKIYITFENADKLIGKIQTGKFVFKYPKNEEFVPFEHVKLMKDGATFELTKESRGDLQEIYGAKLDVIAIEAEEKLTTDYTVDAIKVSVSGEARPADYAGTNDMELSTKEFAPFGERIMTYGQFYLASEDCFTKPGALVTLDFDLTFDEHIERLTPKSREAELKVIRKKPSDDANLNPADVFVDKVVVEYFNGTGWKLLNCDSNYSTLFSKGEAKHVSMKFICPTDWEETQTESYIGRTIRFTVSQADNCYMVPSLHHFPVIKKLKISFDYENKDILPKLVSVISGTDRMNFTNELVHGKSFPVLSVNKYTQDALYIGLSKKPEMGPIGIVIKIKEEQRFEPLPVNFEYSTLKGFEPLKVLDSTEQLSHSGLIYFIPPANFAALNLEDNNNFWLRITRKHAQSEGREQLPVIEKIDINGVRVANIDTKEEQQLFIDEIKPDVSFDLPYDNILDLDVWVNETDIIPNSRKEEMIATQKDNVRVERNIQGNIVAFYVKWTEVEEFNDEAPRESYILDRLNSKLIFGDGIRTDIPRCLKDTAVKVTCRCSVGRLGNVDPGTINSIVYSAPFIGSIENPIKAYGGSSMETFESTLERGANIISTRKRLVSKKDYIVEIEKFSDVIDQAAVVQNLLPDNTKEDGALTFCLLTKDFTAGSHSFHRIASGLKDYLLDHCEMTVDPQQIHIVEPMFVEISVNIWASEIKLEDSFYLTNYLNEIMSEYLNPLRSKGGSFRIGQKPSSDQIRLRLNALKNKLVMKNITIMAKYSDETGTHEVMLDELKKNPYMIVVNGKHSIK